MTGEAAEKIINEYGGVIASIKDGDHVQDVFSLPYSPAKIRYAYFVYTEELINEGLFNEDIYNNLTTTYAMIDTRFVEDPDEINKAWLKYGKDEKATEFLRDKGGLSAFMPSLEKMVEYQNFVADCHGNWGKA